MQRLLTATLAAALLALPAAAQTTAPGTAVVPPAAAPRTVTPVSPSATASPGSATGAANVAATSGANAPLEANQYSTEASAKSHCPADTVVWLNTKSRKYHLSDARSYGKTKHGAYMCQKDADAAGDKQAGTLKKAAAKS